MAKAGNKTKPSDADVEAYLAQVENHRRREDAFLVLKMVRRVTGEKAEWSKIKKGDWVTVSWKMIDKPRKAYTVNVLPPREEAGEDT